MQHTLSYIKINRIDYMTEQELLIGGRNTLLFLGMRSGDNEEAAVETIKLFSEDCQKTGFNVIAETVFIGSGAEAARYLRKIISRIKYIDCVVIPSTGFFGNQPEIVAGITEFMESEGVLLYKATKERLEQLQQAYARLYV